MALATTTLLDEPTTPRFTGVALRVVGPGPTFSVVIERSPNGSTGWVELVRRVFPDGAGGIFVDGLPVTGDTYYYRAKAVGEGYQDSPYTPTVQGVAQDNPGVLKIDSPPLYEVQSRLYGAISSPVLMATGVKQNDGVNSRTLVKGRQVFTCRHKDVLTFNPTYQSVPKFRILGGISYAPGTVWTTADDYRTLLGSITTGTTTLTATAGTFKSSDAGKAIKVTGAGVAGAVLTTTIATYTNSTTVTLSASASTTVTGKLVQVYSGTLLAPLSQDQYDDSTLLGLSASGGTVQARLRQKNTTLTAQSANFSAGTLGLVADTPINCDLGGGAMAYDDKYTVTWDVFILADTPNTGTPTYAQIDIEVTVESNDGSGWIPRGVYTYSEETVGLNTTSSHTVNESVQFTVAGLGINDDWQIRISALAITGNDGGCYCTVDPGSVAWSAGTNVDQFANRTPDPADVVFVEVESA